MIAAALNAHAAATQRSFQQDRTQTVGASEIGMCARRIFFAKNEGDSVYGRDRDADHVDGWGARVRGTVYENAWWEPALRAAYGDRLLYAGAEQRTLVDECLSATPDGVLLLDDGESVAIECKSIDPRTRLDGPKPEHVYQVQVQLGLIRALTNLRPASAIISYTDASFWDEVREFTVPFDQAVFDQARERARGIMLARSVDDVRPEGVIAGGKECERCPFTAACGRARADKVPDRSDAIDALMAETISDLARRARSAKAEGEARIAEAREIEHEVREMLSVAGSRRLDRDGVQVVWSPVKGRPSWDHKAIREAAQAAGIDLTPFERVGDPTDRLVITLSEVPGASARGAVAAQAAS